MSSIIVRVFLSDGSSGEGEIPTSFSIKEESIQIIHKALREITPPLVGVPIDHYPERIKELRMRMPHLPMTAAGLETALFRSRLKKAGISEFDYWGARLPGIKTDITIPFLEDPAELHAWMDSILKGRFRELKVKISGNIEQDMRILNYICTFIKEKDDGFKVRLDGNQGYREKSFLRLMDWCEKKRFRIELVEQPLLKDDLKGLRRIRKRLSIPVILDESVFRLSDLERALEEDCCDGVNIKIAKSGISESEKIMEMARRNNLKLMIGCMTESMIGLSAAIFMAAGSGNFDYIDLDSVFFIRHRSRYGPITVRRPGFEIGSLHGY
ncbi:MAG: enolase C-terminal domain-like protein [Syntrophales bacterium]